MNRRQFEAILAQVHATNDTRPLVEHDAEMRAFAARSRAFRTLLRAARCERAARRAVAAAAAAFRAADPSTDGMGGGWELKERWTTAPAALAAYRAAAAALEDAEGSLYLAQRQALARSA